MKAFDLVSTLGAHPAAAAFPLLADLALAELAEDIAANGLREPIVIDADSGRLVDGRNRLRACELAQVTPRALARKFDGELAIYEYVMSVNMYRRHLTTSQRAMIGADIAEHMGFQQGAGGGQPAQGKLSTCGQLTTSRDDQKTRARAAALVGVSASGVQRARAVIKAGVPELVDSVNRAELAVSTAAHIAKLEPEHQSEILAEGPARAREVAAEARKGRLAPLMSSKKDDWTTPAVVLDPIRAALGPIGLDPCSNSDSIVDARVAWTVDDDGLARDWTGRGLVFVNPPYGRALGPWAEKIKAASERGAELVVLVPARVDTQWWRDATEGCAVWFAWRGRVTFGDATGPAPFPIALIYHGARVDALRVALGRQADPWGRP